MKAETMNNLAILNDTEVISWLLKHEDVIVQHFNIPTEMSPSMHLLSLQMYNAKNPSMTFSLPSIYASQEFNCHGCTTPLKIKKLIKSTFFDDILGTNEISVITRHCKKCKVTYYPGYYETHIESTRVYYSGWDQYPEFQSTHQTMMSMHCLDMLVCLMQKCHITFTGKAESVTPVEHITIESIA